MLEAAAIDTSQIKIPSTIAPLYINNCCIGYSMAALAKMDPYIPSQNNMESGLNNDISKPDQ